MPTDTALLVIDVQDSFSHRPYWRDEELPGFRERLLALIAGCRARAVPIVHVLHQAPGSGGPFDPASGHVRTMDWLPPGPARSSARTCTARSSRAGSTSGWRGVASGE